jgi:ERCC4-related helicase
MLMEVTVIVKIEEEHENRVMIFRTTAEILIRLLQTQFKHVRHYFVGMFNATKLKCCYGIW